MFPSRISKSFDRFNDEDVLNNIEGVIAEIKKWIIIPPLSPLLIEGKSLELPKVSGVLIELFTRLK